MASRSQEWERLLATLTPAEREFATLLLYAAPNYRYELSGLPRLDPNPERGVPSAVAAAKAVLAWRKSPQKPDPG